MASPIRWFRKHAQFFIVIFGVVLMAIFGLGTVFTSLNPADFVSRGGEDTNTVVAQWAGGELRKDDLFVLRQKHFAARRLLNHVYQFAVKENGGNQFPIAVPQILPIARPGTDPTVEQMDEQMINRLLFAKKAEDEGFVVDEKMALDYIAQHGGDVPLSKNMLKQLNRQVNQNIPLTAVVRHIQTELLAQQMESFAQGGLPFDNFNPLSAAAINPTEAIQLFSRSSRQIECQVLPIPVGDYVSKVNDEPPQSELKQLYEEGKYEYPDSTYQYPGFKKLKQAKIQYFVGELETFLKNEVAKLTEAEVQAEYDRLIAADDDFVMEVIPTEKPDNTAEGAGQGQEELNLDDPAPAPETDSDSDAPENTEPVEMPDESGEKTNTALKDDSIAKQEESEDDESGEESTQENSGSNEVESQDDTSDEANSESQQSKDDADASEAVDSNAAEPADQETTKDQADAAAATQDSDAKDPAIEDKPKVERKPKALADVAEELKRRMKTEDARIARDEAIDEAEKAVRKFNMKRSKLEYARERDGGDEEEELTPPDFNALADKLQLQFMETDLINQNEIGDERIGQITTFSFANQQLVQNNVGEQIFAMYEDLPLYQPTSVDDGANRAKVIYWLSEKVPQNVPDFETARDSIVEYWKYQKAIEAAEAEASNIAEKLKDSGKMLKDLYPEKAQDTGAFSWFASFGRFDYGQPASVEKPGESFMEAAFALEKPGDAGSALNDDRKIVYVIQNNSPFVKSLEQVGKDYMEQNFFQTKTIPREVVTAKSIYRRRLNVDWYRELQDDLKVDIVGQ